MRIYGSTITSLQVKVYDCATEEVLLVHLVGFKFLQSHYGRNTICRDNI